MRSSLSIQGLAPVTSTGDPDTEPREAQPSTASSVPGGAATPIYANPALRLEPALGLVVIEFRNSSGDVTSSIPTQRQIQAYKKHALAPQPVDGTGAGDAAASGGGERAAPLAGLQDNQPAGSGARDATTAEGDGAGASSDHAEPVKP